MAQLIDTIKPQVFIAVKIPFNKIYHNRRYFVVLQHLLSF
jgi:hypothetical protein